jgi:hypothetical protein
VDWEQFSKSVARGSFFADFDALSPTPADQEERRQRLRWLKLLRTDRIFGWAAESNSWVSLGLEKGNRDVLPVAVLLLRRYLLDLATRRDVSLISRFWRWVTARVDLDGRLGDLWEQRASRLASTLQASGTRPISEQESEFAQILKECGKVVAGHNNMEWASRELISLATTRSKPPGIGGCPSARVVCVWESPHDPGRLLRAGIVLELRLECRSGKNDCKTFGDDFRDALAGVRQIHGKHNSYAISHELDDLGAGVLVGASGAMSVLVAQRLAARRPDGPQETLAPWVAISSAIDRANHRGMRAGQLAQKAALLAEEGVRVILTANAEGWEHDDGLTAAAAGATTPTSAPITNRHLLPIEVVGIDGGACEFESYLRKIQSLWPATLAPLPGRDRWRFATLALFVLIAVLFGTFLVTRRNETLARIPEKTSWLVPQPFTDVASKREELISWARALAAQVGDDPDRYDRLHGISGPTLLSSAVADGFEILEDLRCFDLTHWMPVHDPRDLKRRPIEPQLFTRRLTLRKTRFTGPVHLQLQYRTSGYCMWWRPERPGDTVRRGHMTNLPAAACETSELDVDLTSLGNDGKPFVVEARGVVWNGFQDQQLHVGLDWAATRTDSPTLRSSLLILLPPSKRLSSAIAFQTEIDSKIRSRSVPSALDFVNAEAGLIYREINAPIPGYIYAAEWEWADRATVGASIQPQQDGPPQ